jgi:hypothetical protein
MPDLLAYYENLPPMPAQIPPAKPGAVPVVYRETFGCLMGDVAFTTTLPPGTQRPWADSSDVDQFTAFSQYVEALIMRFDTDHSGTITIAEAERVFPILKLYLKEAVVARAPGIASILNTDDSLLAVLTYLLANGTIPSAAQYLEWRVKGAFGTPPFAADRGRIVQILSMLNSDGESHCFDNDQVRKDFTPLHPVPASN